MHTLTYATLRSRRLQPVGTETLWLSSLERRVSEDAGDLRLNLSPAYQRGRVWTDDQAARFVGFLAEGGVAPPIYVQRWPIRWPGKTPPDEVVDGLQRITAVLRFGANEVPMETPRGERAYLRDFSESDQRVLRSQSGLILTLQLVSCDTIAQVLALYIRLNRGGTPHTDAEIERVRDMLAEAEGRGLRAPGCGGQR